MLFVPQASQNNTVLLFEMKFVNEFHDLAVYPRNIVALLPQNVLVHGSGMVIYEIHLADKIYAKILELSDIVWEKVILG